MTIGIDEQIMEAEKEVRVRARRYPVMIEKGRLLQDTADAKLARMRAIVTTLHWLADNRVWIAAQAKLRRETEIEQREAAEADEFARDETVAAVLAAFPGTSITDIRHLEEDAA